MATASRGATGVDAPAAPVPGGGERGLLSDEEITGVLRGALRDYLVSDALLAEAVAALRAAEAARWEQLPPEIDPDMGYHYRFLSCSETCWLGRKVLIDGETFRVFRQREPTG
jgi:hypothetical protein